MAVINYTYVTYLYIFGLHALLREFGVILFEGQLYERKSNPQSILRLTIFCRLESISQYLFVAQRKSSFDWPLFNQRLPLVNQRKGHLVDWRFKWRLWPII